MLESENIFDILLVKSAKSVSVQRSSACFGRCLLAGFALRAAVFRMRCNWSMAAAGAHVDVHVRCTHLRPSSTLRFDKNVFAVARARAASILLLLPLLFNCCTESPTILENKILDSQKLLNTSMLWTPTACSKIFIFMIFGPPSETDSLWRMRRNTKYFRVFNSSLGVDLKVA